VTNDVSAHVVVIKMAMTCTLDSLSQFIQRPSSKRFINGFKVRVSVISHSPKLSNGNGSSGPATDSLRSADL
jgi:hypothetical protein